MSSPQQWAIPPNGAEDCLKAQWVVARRHRRAGGVPMKTRRRVVDAIEDRGGARPRHLSRLPACRRDSQIRLFLFSSLLRRRLRRRALGRVRRRRGCPLAVLAVLLPPRVAGPALPKKLSFDGAAGSASLGSRRTRASRAPGPRLPRRGGGAGATTASLLQCAACFARRFEGCGLLQVRERLPRMVCWLSSMA